MNKKIINYSLNKEIKGTPVLIRDQVETVGHK